jgi:hypothetical protein
MKRSSDAVVVELQQESVMWYFVECLTEIEEDAVNLFVGVYTSG